MTRDSFTAVSTSDHEIGRMLAIQAQAGPTLPRGNSTLWQLKTPALYEQFSTRMHSIFIQIKLFESLKKGPFTQFVFKGRFLVPKIGSRRSDCPISRFRFCDENVGRSFVVCSHDPIFRTNKKSSIWCQNDHSDIVQNLSAPFIFQEECLMKIEHALFLSVFFKIMDPCFGRSFSMCSHDPIFGTNKNRILKNGSCERALTLFRLGYFGTIRLGGSTLCPPSFSPLLSNHRQTWHDCTVAQNLSKTVIVKSIVTSL